MQSYVRNCIRKRGRELRCVRRKAGMLGRENASDESRKE